MPIETASSILYAHKEDSQIVGFSSNFASSGKIALLYSLVAVAPVLGSSKLRTVCECPGPNAKAGGAGAAGTTGGGGGGAGRTGGGCGRLGRRSWLSLVHVPWLRLCLRCTTSALSLCYDNGSILSACAEEACYYSMAVPSGSRS